MKKAGMLYCYTMAVLCLLTLLLIFGMGFNMGVAFEKQVANLIEQKKYNEASTLLIKEQNAHPEYADNFFYLVSMGACALLEGKMKAATFCFNKAFAYKGK